MRIRSDSIVNKIGNGAVQFTTGITAEQPINIQGDLNISGIATVGFLTAKNANVAGIITATTFVGNGSGLTNVPALSLSKSIAFRYIFGDPFIRS